jgi:hypothetical protein
MAGAALMGAAQTIANHHPAPKSAALQDFKRV